VKRALDVLAAAVGLVVLSPILAGIALAVRISMGSPVIFRQERAGFRGRPFTLYKFRSMRDAVDGRGVALSDSARLTAIGRFLRRSSLDELPELWNVLKGDMSLVGPRPLFLHYLPLYNATQARRHDVPPGMTGWTQVSGRNALSWDEKFALDVWYVDNCSFWLDLRILLMTARAVVFGRGISQPGHATAEPFIGAAAGAAGGTGPDRGASRG
jgi:lipopolysaccharide/colanic/teichoic acid biosynthesis glycosyltransferase